MKRAKHIFASLLLWGAASVFADERVRPSHTDQLNGQQQTAVKVTGARVSYANYAAIRRDFPQVKDLTDAQINDWVLENFAYISAKQAQLNGIRNSEIPVDNAKTKVDTRPPFYGRAGVLEAQHEGKTIGLVDIKGLGMADVVKIADQVKAFAAVKNAPAALDQLRTQDHSDGLMRHGEAIAELTRQTALQRLYDLYNHQHGTDYQTVESYFLIELPFDVLGPKGTRERAALYGRQAHWRGQRAVDSPKGVYTDDFGGKQSSIFGSAVDFGGVLIEDPRLKAKFGLRPNGKLKDPQDSLPWAYAHETANGFRDGDAHAVFRHLDEMLEGIQADWAKLPPSATVGFGEQKKYVEWAAIARKTHPTRSDVSEMIPALKGTKNQTSLARDTFIISQMSPAMLHATFGNEVILNGMPMDAIAVAFPKTAHGATDPQVRALLEALLEALPKDRLHPVERVPTMALAAALVARHFPPAEQAAALAPFQTIFMEKLRRDLGKSGYGTRLELLTAALRAHAPVEALFPLIEKELEALSPKQLQSDRLSLLIEALVGNSPPERTNDFLRRYYPRLGYLSRLAVLHHFGETRNAPDDIVQLMRSNLSDGKTKIDPTLLTMFWSLKTPGFKKWLVEQLGAPGMDPGSVKALWEMAKDLHKNELLLEPAMTAALANRTPDYQTGLQMVTILLDGHREKAKPAIDAWLQGLTGLQRKAVSQLTSHDYLNERAIHFGTHITCADAWRAVRSTPKGLVILSVPLVAFFGVLTPIARSENEKRKAREAEEQHRIEELRREQQRAKAEGR